MHNTYASTYGLPYSSIDDPEIFKNHFAADMDAKLHSLCLARQKKQNFVDSSTDL